MYLIITYVIGLISCAILNILDERNDYDIGLPTIVFIWVLSPLLVPIAIVVGILALIGLLIRYIGDCIEEKLNI